MQDLKVKFESALVILTVLLSFFSLLCIHILRFFSTNLVFGIATRELRVYNVNWTADNDNFLYNPRRYLLTGHIIKGQITLKRDKGQTTLAFPIQYDFDNVAF